MRIDIFTLFPQLITGYCSESILGIAQKKSLLDVRAHNFREYGIGKHKTVDDAPFGGGAGMVLKPEPIVAAVRAVEPPKPLLYLSPTGRRFDQNYAEELAGLSGFSLLCGRYEGVDERVRTNLVDGEISVGDYVLAGGEAAALVVLEAVGRLLPGVLGNKVSARDESFSHGLLEYPQYTRPATFESQQVPDVLLSGNHERVGRWRTAQSLYRTLCLRPDLIEDRGGLTVEEKILLDEFDLEV